MFLEIEKFNKGIFQEAMNFWYDFDNETHIQTSDEFNKIYIEIGKVPPVLDGWIGTFYYLYLQNPIDYEQEYMNFILNKNFKPTIEKMSSLIRNKIMSHINPLNDQELFLKLRLYYELFGEGTLYDFRRNFVHTMDSNINKFKDPLEFVGYPRWHVFIRAISLIDQINSNFWLNLDRFLYLAYEIQAKLKPNPLASNNCGIMNSDYEWLCNRRSFCSNLNIFEIDKLFYENFYEYIINFVNLKKQINII